jgi:hypothetical protein
MTPGEWVEDMLQQGDSHYEIAYFVLWSAAESAEADGGSPVAHCGIEASIMVSEYGLDENEVNDALEDVLFMEA